ncbi:SixA phosphatase family protein [Coralloluteibacterium stylophorae]|uniref:Histidine phosphatase family protein n=1 Tax=Coralloluteibacterium stylophorae TaxID=1776034 RepID=A0A8J7VTG4_9GAMM|nr:histidine phosphatase family protein [Coralloluteibacterium stylophorae]
MTDLILLRHAHAEPAAPAKPDSDRPLSEVGWAEAEAAARWLAAQGARPARILCSPARRTRETCRPVVAALGEVEVREEPSIYEAMPGTLLALAEEHADAGCLLLVGHNPGLEHLLALLTTGRSGDARGMAPASVAWLRLADGTRWEPGAAELVRFWSP